MANKYTKTPNPPIKELKRFYDNGMTQVELAKKYSTTQKIVWRWMRDLGIKARIPVKRNQWGKNNDNWKGDEAGYKALHYRLYKIRGKPKECEKCGTKNKNKIYQWANLTGNFANINDYKRMCKSCHSKLDKIIKNITK